jgi:hypothetical protein
LKPDLPQDVASIAQSQIEAWTTELEALLLDPRVRKFSDLREKIDDASALIVEADAPPTSSRFWSPRYRRGAGRRKGLGVPDNELSALKSEDLEDLVLLGPPAERL